MPEKTWALLTPPNTGAIAVVQVPAETLSTLTTRTEWEFCKLYLVNIPEIDEVVAVKLNEEIGYVMPHSGIQILRKLGSRFAELGIEQSSKVQYPEAEDEIEAAMLATLAVAESPLAVDLLLAQPPKLRNAIPTQSNLERSKVLNHLIHPPKAVLLGAPNTGKSTLMNALTKQDTSIVHSLPGATRDAVGARINCDRLVIDLYDLPGFRSSDDPIEQDAISLAKTIVEEATLTILIADAGSDWLQSTGNSIRVATKSDMNAREDADICVCALSGENTQELATLIRDTIVPPEVLKDDSPWFFYSPIAE